MGIDMAWAASGIVSATADDPDDADSVYSADDTITIVFPAATNASASGSMTEAEILANFTVANPPGLDWQNGLLSGSWDGTSTILTIFVNTTTGVTTEPVVGTTDFNYNPAGGNLHYANATEFTGTIRTLQGDFGLFVAVNQGDDGGGSGCSADCVFPTLGVDDFGKRFVENGFTYNGKPVDVQRFYTPFPLLPVKVGDENLAEFKIYENLGPSNVKHFELAFGLARGQVMSESHAMIKWDWTMLGSKVDVLDPNNVLRDVRVETSEGKCREDSPNNDCLIVKVHHTFRGVPDFNIIGTQVWDERFNSMKNYYNHGVDVEGIPEDAQVMIRKDIDGNYKTYAVIDGNVIIDENGNPLEKSEVNRINSEEVHESTQYKITSHGYDRNHPVFNTYKEGQKLLAEYILESILNP